MHTESVHAVQYVNAHHCESLQILPQNQCRTREVCGIILDLLVGVVEGHVFPAALS